MAYRQIEAAEVSGLLSELLERCSRSGISADIYIVGGAALTMQLGRPRMTPDFDVLLNPKAEIIAVAEAMADELGLNPDWVNSNAFAFLGGLDSEQDAEAMTLDFPDHRVRVASPRYLLAMKVAAMREKDVDDAAACIRHLGYRDADKVIDEAIAIIGHDSIAWGAPHGAELREWIRLDVERVVRRAWSGRDLWGGAAVVSGPFRAKTTPASNRGSFAPRQNSTPDTGLS